MFNHTKVIDHKESFLVRWLKAKNKKILEVSLDHPYKILGSLLILFIGSISLIPLMGKDFLPPFNEGTATISLLAQPGISLEESNQKGTEAERLILQIPEVNLLHDEQGELNSMNMLKEFIRQKLTLILKTQEDLEIKCSGIFECNWIN